MIFILASVPQQWCKLSKHCKIRNKISLPSVELFFQVSIQGNEKAYTCSISIGNSLLILNLSSFILFSVRTQNRNILQQVTQKTYHKHFMYIVSVLVIAVVTIFLEFFYIFTSSSMFNIDTCTGKLCFPSVKAEVFRIISWCIFPKARQHPFFQLLQLNTEMQLLYKGTEHRQPREDLKECMLLKHLKILI